MQLNTSKVSQEPMHLPDKQKSSKNERRTPVESVFTSRLPLPFSGAGITTAAGAEGGLGGMTRWCG